MSGLLDRGFLARYGSLVPLLGILIIVGLMAPSWLVELCAFSLARGLAVLGVFILWRCGLVSFGHALYFGLGAYSCAFLEIAFGSTDFLIRIMFGTMVSGLVGALLSTVMCKYRGIYFAMLNLAVSMLFYGILIRNTALGTTDGFVLSRPTFWGQPIGSRLTIYWCLVVVLMVSLLLTARYLHSTAGKLAVAIRDNELRIEFLGRSVGMLIRWKYLFSAILAGLGGVFAATLFGQVDPDSMVGWAFSGELVFIAVLAGNFSVVAPIYMSIIFDIVRSYALQVAPGAWQLIFGLCLLVSIILKPDGLWPRKWFWKAT